MNEPEALDERLRTLVMQSFERGGERLHEVHTSFFLTGDIIFPLYWFDLNFFPLRLLQHLQLI
ncbi:MAG: hypothetical protein GY702_03560 [Desulfobulbaceae bacterium]|nr:hypothetical protein [Desulfobulbaceae bacterium]